MEPVKEILEQDERLQYHEGIPSTSCLRSTFPYKNFLSFSIGASKFHAILERSTILAEQKYAERLRVKENIVYVERYDLDSARIVYFKFLEFDSNQTLNSMMTLSTKQSGDLPPDPPIENKHLKQPNSTSDL